MTEKKQKIKRICDECDKEGYNESDFVDCRAKNHHVTDYLDVEKRTHTQYAKEIMSEYEFATLSDTKQILIYENGVYTDRAEIFIEEQCELRIPDCTSYLRREVTKTIKSLTYKSRLDFDADPIILNVKNGLINLITGEFSSHSNYYLSRVQIPVTYDKKQAPIKFVKFMMECLPYHDDREAVYEHFASCLLKNSVRLEKAFMYVGDGSNGKSTFLDVVYYFLGAPNVSNASLQDLNYTRFARARLDGKLQTSMPIFQTMN